MAQATAVSPQALLKAAKALVETYNAKDWDRARAAITTDFVYEGMGTGSKLTGAEATLESYKADDGTVVLEVTWSGTHRCPLQTPDGPIARPASASRYRPAWWSKSREGRRRRSGTTSTW